jgi:CheY-like chemotaxis protein
MNTVCYKSVTMSPIFIVDDSTEDSDQLNEQLKRLAITNPVRTFVDCETAQAYLQGIGPYADRTIFPLPSIIILDLCIPGMDGFQFLKWVKSEGQFQQIPIIAISGAGDLNAIRRAYQFGATSFLTKPCRAQELENFIRAYPQHWRLAEGIKN